MEKLILESVEFLTNWGIFWHSAAKLGYSGTAILYRKSKFISSFAKSENLFEDSLENLAKNSAQNSNQNSRINSEKSKIICQKSEKIQELEMKSEFRNVGNRFWNEKLAKNLSENLEEIGKKLDGKIKSEQKVQEKNQKWQILEEIIGINHPDFDIEGRTTGLILAKITENNSTNSKQNSNKGITSSEHNLKSDFKNVKEALLLLNCYYPQGGRIGRIDYKLRFYQQVLDFVNEKILEFAGFGMSLQVVLTGDFNTTFADIDLARPKENRKTTGCLPIEREILNLLCQNLSLVDIYRLWNPNLQEFTYWDQITRARERNVGWRIDYFLVSKSLAEKNLAKIQFENAENSSENGETTLENLESVEFLENLTTKIGSQTLQTETLESQKNQNKTLENIENLEFLEKSENQLENNLEIDKEKINKIQKTEIEITEINLKSNQKLNLNQVFVKNQTEIANLNAEKNLENSKIKVQKVEILGQVLGSDHCPVLLEID